jgi:methylenetetrahydrofolate dehydrogenase (NADP+)/methenyltetrahydrofolate cyclohydrolase
LPLPAHLDEERVIAAIEPIKDVDGCHPFNAGELYLGRPRLVPATPLGIMALLAEHRIRSRAPRRSSSAAATSSASRSHTCSSRRTRRSRSATRARPISARYTLEADVLVVAVGSAEW